MGIKKQEFYEGATLHKLARTGLIARIQYDAPFFVLNDWLCLHIKYSTKGRSPWGFTFTADEQRILKHKAKKLSIAVALVCGSDGIAAFSYDDLLQIAPCCDTPVHVSCYRDHGEHYEVNGPDGTLNGKVSPSRLLKLLHT